jgi:hypothetical protein
MAQIILSGSGTWNLPSDWNDADNTIEMYGSGSAGETTATTSRSGYGGGGGGYVKAVNVPLKNYESIATGTQYFAKTYSTTGYNAGLWYGTVTTDGEGFSTLDGPLVHGGGGYANGYIFFPRCQILNTTYSTITYAGGAGGSGRTSSTAAGGGGGGAAGPNGAGGSGGSNTTTLNTTGRGGGGGNGGGNGSGTSATAGTAGTSAGAGGTGGANNTSGSAGASVSVTQSGVSQSATVGGGTASHSYNSGTGSLSFSLFGGGSTVNSQTVDLNYRITLKESGTVTWNLTANSESGYDWGYLYINSTQYGNRVSGTTSDTGSTTLAAGTYTINLKYTKDTNGTAGTDTFSGSLSFPPGSTISTGILSGGGGGGCGDYSSTVGLTGGAGGGYGGGGGGSGSSSSTNTTGGFGGPGIIIINYTPIANGNFFTFF